MKLWEQWAARLRRPSKGFPRSLPTEGHSGFLSDTVYKETVIQQAEEDPRRFKIRLAGRVSVQQEAHALLNRRYEEKGYLQQAAQASPREFTFLTYRDAKPSGTLTIGLDSHRGLHADELYGRELDGLRAKGLRLCEFIRMASLPACDSRAATLAAMFHTALIFAHQLNGCTDVVVEVNPRHVGFYTRVLGFELMGPLRNSPRVNAPAVLLRCGFAHIDQQIRHAREGRPGRHGRRSFYAHSFSGPEESAIRLRMQGRLRLLAEVAHAKPGPSHA